MKLNSVLLLAICSFFVFLSGCTEGVFWRTGYLSPWARQKWAEEEQISPTLFTKREKLREMAESAVGSDVGNQERVSQIFADVVKKDQIALMRIEAVSHLAQFRNQTAAKALQLATRDPNSQVRIAAIRAWEIRGDQEAFDALTGVLANNADVDMRLAATRALASFKSAEAIQSLSSALADPDPAMQLRAADSLAEITGEDFGTDIQAWQQFVDNNYGRATTQTANKSYYDVLEGNR